MAVLCKRCGRVLKSAKSIELGYGPTCYKIINLQDNPINVQEEIKFLKMEIKLVKNIMRELRTNNFTSCQNSPIIKIRKEEKRPEREINKGQMIEVIQELKTCFQTCDGDVKNLLRPIQIEPNLNKSSQLAIV
ncbi:MAG: DUF6011 domain-containing protein [Candidatus Heimdallarchaeota archaeon]